jgi:hypothetical protein
MGSDSKARRGLRALAVTTMTATTLIGTSSGTAGAVSANNGLRAQQGAQWLANQITHNAGVLQNFGKADPVDTAYAVIGLRATGVDKPASDEAVAALKTKLGTDLDTGGHLSPGALAEYLMAAVSDGQDPRHFGGTGAPNNLVSRLLATARTTGPDKGLFGASDPSFDGAFRQGLALEALKAADVAASMADPPTVRERHVGGLPGRPFPRVSGRGPENVRRSRHEQHLVGSARTCRVGQVPACGGGAQFIADQPVTRWRVPVRRREEPTVGSRLDGPGHPGAARRAQRPDVGPLEKRDEHAVHGAGELPARLHQPELRCVHVSGKSRREPVRDRAVGAGDGGQDPARRVVVRVGHADLDVMLIVAYDPS